MTALLLLAQQVARARAWQLTDAARDLVACARTCGRATRGICARVGAPAWRAAVHRADLGVSGAATRGRLKRGAFAAGKEA